MPQICCSLQIPQRKLGACLQELVTLGLWLQEGKSLQIFKIFKSPVQQSGLWCCTSLSWWLISWRYVVLESDAKHPLMDNLSQKNSVWYLTPWVDRTRYFGQVVPASLDPQNALEAWRTPLLGLFTTGFSHKLPDRVVFASNFYDFLRWSVGVCIVHFRLPFYKLAIQQCP